ncbi:MAG TPA: 2-oxoglutarate and iron-dependent oxygenase domain-containing protein, partial [Acidimicrobiales bacterium]|nr:2-oxoglutarate and iron-dependent oxygenase domain-containing protein [Acidimicrobiales bacterium]
MPVVPVIDITALRDTTAEAAALDACARAIDAACRDVGFFCITGHGISPHRLDNLDSLAREFFARPEDEKAAIAMAKGGTAWRGWFAEGTELTAGRPDHKEGIYFGSELPGDDPRVVAGLPLHGRNQFPDRPEGLREAVLEWIESMTALGQDVLRGMSIGLGLDADWIGEHLTADPTVLFRIFTYPAVVDDSGDWGVAEHTDYGLITVLAHDGTPGLQVRPRGTDEWLDVPGGPDVIVVNLGDMLEAMTGGRYRSTAHRVRRPTPEQVRAGGRLSFPFFLDP